MTSVTNIIDETRDFDVTFSTEDQTYYFFCPWCKNLTAVAQNEIRCTIFRHANFKDFSFVPPHASKTLCDSWLKNDLIHGCSKPFVFDGKSVRKCDYI